MWANSNFIVSEEQQTFLRRTEIPEDLFEGGYDAEAEGEALRKRFFRGPVNPWGNAGASPELSKAFGDEQWKQRLEEAEPFDSGDELRKKLAEKLEPLIEDVLRKSMNGGGHGHFRIEKSANGTECCIDCSGQTIACRTGGVTFTDAEITELRRRCGCDGCKNS